MSRPTKQLRSAATREKLISTTLKTLLEKGYTRSTTNEIVIRAEVSRGALTYHFPAKEDLVAASFRKLLMDATDEIRENAVLLKNKRSSIDNFIDYLWSKFSGPFFYMSLEMVVECRHNPTLNERLKPVIQEFHSALDDAWSLFLNDSEFSTAEATTALNMTACLMRGMGVQKVLRPDPPYYNEILELWKLNLPQMIVNATNNSLSDRNVNSHQSKR